MAASPWTEVASDSNFIALPEEEKSKVRQRYFNNVISKDVQFGLLPDEEKDKVNAAFFGERIEATEEELSRAFSEVKMEKVDIGKSIVSSKAFQKVVAEPQEGAEILREAFTEKFIPLLDKPTPTVRSQISPLGPQITTRSTVGRGLLKLGTQLIPITPVELTAMILGPALLAKGASAIAPQLVKKFPRIYSALQKRGFSKISPPIKPDPNFPKVPRIDPDRLPPKGGLPVTDEARGAIIQAKPPSPQRDMFNQQLSKFNVSDDAKAVFVETSKAFSKQIDKARRGKIAFKGTEKFAQDLNMSIDDLLKKRKGKAFNAEELEAAKGLTGASLENVNTVKQAYILNPTSENLVKLNGAISRHALVQASFMGARAEAGRALSILRKSTNPADIAQGNFETILDALGGKKLNEEIALRLASIDPTDVAALNKFMRDVVKAKTTDQIFEFFINGILSSPMTHKVNITSTALFIGMRIPEKGVRAIIDKVVGPFTGKRTAFFGEVPIEIYGLIKGIPDGLRRGLHVIRKGTSGIRTKFELNRVPAIPGKVGEVQRTPTRLLVAEDEFFKGIVHRMELSTQSFKKAKLERLSGKKLAKRIAELETNPTDDMLEAILKEELLRTFQNKPGTFTSGLSRARQAPGVRYIFPFLQTPGNIVSRFIEKSPLGWIKVVNSIAKKKGQEEIVTNAANATLGSALSASIAYYTLQGRITGNAPRNAADRDKFFRSGKLPYAIKIGDKWYSYARLEPLSMTIGATAEAVLRGVEANEDIDATMVGAILTAIPRFILSQTYLTGARDLLDAMEDEGRYLDRWIFRQVGNVVPFSAFGRWLAQQMDPVIRQPTNIIEAIQANIPGLSKNIPPKLGVFGEPSTRPTDLFSRVITPRSLEKIDPLDTQDSRLERKTGFPSRRIGGVKLTQREFNEMLNHSGKIIAFARRASFDYINTLSPKDAQQFISKIENAARTEARMKIYFQVLDRIKDEKQRLTFIEYGVNNFGLSPWELLSRSKDKK